MKYRRLLPWICAISLLCCTGIDKKTNDNGPEKRVTVWIEALEDRNNKSVDMCFIQELRKGANPYCGCDQSLMFWRDEMMEDKHSLECKGFKGEYYTHYGNVENNNVAFVHPMMPYGPHSGAIWLIMENGSWKICKLFIRPPREFAIDGN